MTARHRTGALARLLAAPVIALLLVAGPLAASDLVGLYGIVERVVFEPDERAPQRIQIWGAFAYAQLTMGATSPARRGYLYFELPDGGGAERPAALAEWTDLRAMAGTGEAIAFGRWGLIGDFRELEPARLPPPPTVVLGTPANRYANDLRVRPASEKPFAPATYRTNTGIVKVPAEGSRSEIVRALREALRAP